MQTTFDEVTPDNRRFVPTRHVPHDRESGLWFDETATAPNSSAWQPEAGVGMERPHVVVVGGGFAGFWAAASAAAAARAADRPADVTLVSSRPSLSVRPRLYEADLGPTVVELAPVLEPIGVDVRIGSATHLDPRRHMVRVDGAWLPFDAGVVATRSSTPLPSLPGLAEHAHRIDVSHRAAAFRAALGALRRRAGTVRVTVVGGGLTGIELATELASEPDVDVTLVDSGVVGDVFGDAALSVVRGALADLGVRVVDGDRVAAASRTAVALQSGGTVDHDLLVWTGGLRANVLRGLDAFERDELGRLVVDEHLRLPGGVPVWAAGDSARFLVDGQHAAPMSCQFAIPSGQLAGHNAAVSVLGGDPLPLTIGHYVTCVDLGAAGGLLTRGWDRVVALTGEDGKRVKAFINRTAIYPPTAPAALLDVAAHPADGHDWTDDLVRIGTRAVGVVA